MITKAIDAKCKMSFSVLLPIYQRDDLEYWFEKVIASCFQGEIEPEAVIVAVDGPLSGSFENKISVFKKKYPIVVVRSNERVGLSQILNLGLSAVKSDYVFRVDGDDISRPERWSLQMEKLKQGYVLVGGHIQEVDNMGIPVAKRIVPTTTDSVKRFASRRNPFNHMAVAFNTEIARKLGGYPHIFLKEDWALWIEFLSAGYPCTNINEILVDASAGENMYQRRGGVKNALSEWQIQMLLVKKLDKNKFIAFIDFVLKISILLSPVFVRKFVYENFLRLK